MMNKKFLIFLAVIFVLLIAPISAENNITIDNSTLIQDTIDEADDGDVVYLNPGTYNESGIKIDKDITLQGLGDAKYIVIDGGQRDSIISIDKKVTVRFNNITFINGKSDNYGGAVTTRIAESVHISNCIFENNTAIKDGGALFIESKFNPIPSEFFYGYLETDNCSFINNYAYGSGGAVATYYADSDIKNSEFIDNYAGDFAGALSFLNGIFTISSSKFENNYADYDGGAIRQNMESKLYIEDSQFINNTAKEWGGAIYNWLGNLVVKNSTISNNTAGIRGGGIFTAGPLTATFSQITDNNAEYGGALYVFQEFYSVEPIVTFNNDVITGNTAVKGPLVYYLLLTYVKSNYENNYWGDINPNSTEWAEKFVTKEYTDAAPETWLEKSPYDVAENTPSKNETGNGKTTGLNQKSTNEKTTANSKTNNAFSSSQNSTNEKSTASSMAVNAFSFSQNSTNEKSTTNSVAGKSANPISGHDQNSKSASYLTKKNAITNKVNSINYLNLVLIIIILMMWGYGLYRFRN